jgi:hypothetical protein
MVGEASEIRAGRSAGGAVLGKSASAG